MKRSTFASVFALLALAVPTAHAGIDSATCHHHYPSSCPSRPPTRIVTVARTDGFDWGDAGIGAAGALGAVLVAGGLGVLFRRPARALT